MNARKNPTLSKIFGKGIQYLASKQRPKFISGRALDMLSISASGGEMSQQLAFLQLSGLGVFCMKEALDLSLVNDAKSSILSQLAQAENVHYFGTVQNRNHRYDYALDIQKPTNAELLTTAVKRIAGVLEKYLGPNPLLVEFSALVPFPGATDQSPHSDTALNIPEDHKQRSKIISCFLYLTNVTSNSGATDIYPGTHTHFHFTKDQIMGSLQNLHYYDNPDAVFPEGEEPPVRFVVPSGSLVCYDSAVRHRGSANRSDKPRIAVLFSFMSNSGIAPLGSTFSIRREFWKKYRIKEGTLSPYPRSEHAQETQPHGFAGRFCFGTLNGRRSELSGARSIPTMPMCTDFSFSPDSWHNVTVSYDRKTMIATLLVNGKIGAEEKRGVAWADGPLSVNYDCHNKGTPDRFAEPFGGSVKNLIVSSSPESSPILHVGKNEQILGERIQLIEHVRLPPLGEDGSILISCQVKPSQHDSELYHSIVLIGGGMDEYGPGTCCGMDGLAIVWSARHNAVIDDEGEASGIIQALRRDLNSVK